MDECSTQCKAMKMLVFGSIILLTRIYTTLDIWIVIGCLLVFKAIILLLMPKCPCTGKAWKNE